VDRVLGWLFARLEVTPEVIHERCLAVKGTGCTACADVCPHEAITVTRRVSIDGVDCTGCGICVAVCPSFALEPRGGVPAGAVLRCSKVEGDAPSVICLARLSPPDIVRAGRDGEDVLLVHGACEGCATGDATVPARVDASATAAMALAVASGRRLQVDVEERARVDVDLRTRHLSRRDLLRSSGTRMRRTAADALAPLERLAPDEPATERTGAPLPQRWIDTLDLLTAADPPPDTLVPVRLPRLEPGCILCPSCTRACPTDALERVFDEAGSVALRLDPQRCIGCDACVGVCPVHVVRMDDEVTWGELRGGATTLASSGASAPPAGSVTR
jgi:ferredoxin